MCVCVCVCVRAWVCVCVCVRVRVCVCVTGFWKTDQIVTLGLFHFIGTANGHTRKLHIQLPGLGDWCAFLERVLLTL